MKKTTSVLLLASLFITLAACTEAEPTNPQQQSTSDTLSQTETANHEPLDQPDLPAVDMNGETFTIMSHGWFSYAPLAITDIVPEEEVGDRLNDAAYRRAINVMDKYGCTLKWARYDDHLEGNDVLYRSVTAGDTEFDIALTRGIHYSQQVTSGILTPLTDVPYLNLDAPYYDDASLNITTLDGTSYGVVSDLSTVRYQSVACVFANLNLFSDYDLGNIYEIVQDGKWTIDKMFEMGKAHEADLDNNGMYDREDRFTVTYINSSTSAFLIGSGVELATVKNGEIELTFDSAENIDLMMKATEYFLDPNKSYYYHHRSTDTADEHNMFMQRHSLFHVGGIYHGSLFRNMEDDFAIIPIPKLYEEQETYRSTIFNNITLTTIPVTNDKLDLTGIILEELCYQGKKDIYPEMYEKILKDKIARDKDSQRMIDIIFDNISYDAGLFYFPALDTVITTRFRTYDQTYASQFASIRSSVEKSLEDLMDGIG